MTGKAIFSTLLAAPPIIISDFSEISEIIIGGATGMVLKMGQYLDSGEEVSVNTDRYSEKLGPDVDRPPQARGLHWTPISRNEVSIYRYLRDRVKVFSL